MNLIEAKYLEYTINVFFKECLERKGITSPTYKILWKHTDKLFFANTLNVDDNYTVLASKLDTDLTTYHKRLNDSDSDNFPFDIRKIVYDKYFNDIHARPISLYKTPLLLLAEAISLVNSLKEFRIDNPEYRLLNVSYLDSKIELPFMLVNKDFELEPVSLIEVSEN